MASLPNIQAEGATGLGGVFEKIQSGAGIGLSAAGSGVEKLGDSVLGPLMATFLGGDFILTQAVTGMASALSGALGGIGGLLSGGVDKRREKRAAIAGDTSNTNIEGDSTTINNITNNIEEKQINQPASMEQVSAAASPSDSGGDDFSPIKTLRHPEMRRVPRIPFIVRNMAMLASRVSDMMQSGSGGDDLEESLREQTFEIIGETEKRTIEKIDSNKEETDRLITFERENQPNLLERREEYDRNKKTLNEQERQTELLEEMSGKLDMQGDDEGGGIGDMLKGVLGTLGGFVLGKAGGLGGLMKMFQGGLKMLMRFAGFFLVKIALVVSVFSGIMDGIERFKETGNIIDAIWFGIQSMADSFIKIFTLGSLNLESLQGIVSDWIENVVNWTSDLLGKGFDWMGGVWDNFMDWIKGNMDDGIQLIKDVWNFFPLVRGFKFIQSLFEAFPEMLRSMARNTLSRIPGLRSVPGVKSFIEGSGDVDTVAETVDRSDPLADLTDAEKAQIPNIEPAETRRLAPGAPAGSGIYEKRVTEEPTPDSVFEPVKKKNIDSAIKMVESANFESADDVASQINLDVEELDEEKKIDSITSIAQEISSQSAALDAQYMGDAMSQIREAEKDIDHQKVSNILTNNNQVVNAPQYDISDGPRNPRKEDYAAGTMNRDGSW